MAERITVRQRFPGSNEFHASDSILGDKRLWGNEGANRYRQSTGAKLRGKFEIFDGGGSRSPDSSDPLDSDPDLDEAGHGAKCDSDSDSDHQRWTKNPLMIRKVKRSIKSQQAEKRWSGIAIGDVVTGSNNNNNLYPYNEGGINERLNLGRSTNSNVCGSSSKGSSKYQRLEEMRRRRLNLSVTSDEESTAPTTKTSSRYGSHIRSFPASGNKIEFDRQMEAYKPHFGAETVHKVSVQAGLASQSATLPTRNIQVAHKVNNYSTRDYQPTVSPPARAGFSSQLLSSDFSEKITPRILTNQQPSTRHYQPQRIESQEPIHQQADVTGSRQPFYKIVNTKSPPTTRAFSNASPQVTVHQFTTQLPVHSFNSTVDTSLKSNGPQSLHNIKQRESPSRVQVSQTATLFGSSQQSNSGPVMTHGAAKEKLAKSANKILQTGLSSLRRCGQSDDSLDELVESNIRYLDSTTDRATNKRNTNSVRVLNQSDPKNVCLSGYSTGQYNQPSVQVRTSTSIQLHVSVPMDAYPTNLGTAAPHLLIEPASDRHGFDNQGISPPDVVPRKIARDVSWTSSRTNSQYHDRDSLTQSDNPDQNVVDTNYLKNYLHPEAALTRGRASGDGKTRSDTEVGRPMKQMERGMFSDAEYDIEVSERVKKWETLLKVRNTKTSKHKHCDTIVENMEGEAPASTNRNDPRKTALSCQQLDFPHLNEVVDASTVAPRELTYEKSHLNSEKWTATNVPPVETKARRLFQTGPGPPLNAQSQSASKVHHPLASTIRDEKAFINNDQTSQQMFAHRMHSIPRGNTPGESTNKAPLIKNYEQQDWPQTDTPRMTRLSQDEHQDKLQTKAELSTRPSKLTDARDVAKRRSAYREELDEISGMKTDTVINLRRHFDTGSTTVTSDDDLRSVSTASAKLARPSKEDKTQHESVDWSNVLPGYKTMIKDSDLWSPNLESTRGVPVSIERVTARTLQTIPFSEDPFWKEMEEMTSFDPTSTFGHAGIAQDRSLTVDPVRSHNRVELITSQSLTLPSQSWGQAIPITDRIHKSKSLYTPNITSMSVSTNRKTKSGAAIALDAVLDDINRSSKERKQQNHGEKPVEAEKTSTVSALARVSRDLQNHSNATQSKTTVEDGHDALRKPIRDANFISITSQPIALDHIRSEEGTGQSKQKIQHQPPQEQKRQVDKPQISQGILSGYHLDPQLLKQKLLKTGLVVETYIDEAPEQYRRSWPRSSTPGNSVTSTTTSPSYTKVTVQSNNMCPPQQSVLSTLAQPGPALAGSTRYNHGKQAGLSTLDNLQNALSPFRSTSYQPGPESLYGLSKLESFRESNPSTSEEVHTSVPELAYHNKTGEDTEPTSNKESSLSSSSSRYQEVNKSMDDLKNLALDVEQRINVIKSRLQSANENSLDSILSSLRALAPEVRRHENEPTNFEDLYTTKKSKLSDALTELDRIYESLELNERDVKGHMDKDEHKVYGRHTSNYPIISTQPRSIHLRPMQTRISSVFIRGMDNTNKNNTDKESQSDVLSKSFQAIVDEVNKTTELLSRVAERNKQENMAPAIQKQTFKTAVKPGNTKLVSSLACPITDAVATADTSPTSARPTQAVNSVDRKLRQKLESNVRDDTTPGKTASENASDREFGTEFTQRKVLQPASSVNQVPPKMMQNTVKVTASASTKQTPSPSNVTRLPTTPVRNNPATKEEETIKQQSSEKTLRMSSPTLPKVTISPGSDLKLQSQQVLSQKRTEETSKIKQISETKRDPASETSQLAASAPTTKECDVSGNSECLHTLSVSSTATTNFTNSTNIATSTSLSGTANGTSSVTENKFRIESADLKLTDTESTFSADPKTEKLVEEEVAAMTLDRLSSCQEKVDSVDPNLHPQGAPDVAEVTENQDTTQRQIQTTDTKENIKSSEPIVSSSEQFSSNNAAHSHCGKCAVSFLVKKVGEPEAKVATSESCSLHPSSPLNKQVVSPSEKQTLDPGKQAIGDDIQDGPPETWDKELQTKSSGESTPSNGYQTPKEGGSPQEVMSQDTDSQQQSPINRPNSIHEHITCSETVEPGTQDTDMFRKSASSGEINCDTS